MKTFRITIEETISQDFEVEAEDMEQAMEIAEEKYNNCEFVLEPGEVGYKQMQCEDIETNESTEWMQF